MMQEYLWLKALHIIAVISWMAGMLYLPRLYVYHVTATPGSEADAMLKVMERRLLRYIINPAMIATFLFGGMLVYRLSPGIWHEAWWHGKLGLIIVMSVLHGMLARHRKAFEKGENNCSSRYFRILNEMPTLAMIGIVLLVVLKPI